VICVECNSYVRLVFTMAPGISAVIALVIVGLCFKSKLVLSCRPRSKLLVSYMYTFTLIILKMFLDLIKPENRTRALRVLSIMPNRPIRDQYEHAPKMERHFPIKPGQPVGMALNNFYFFFRIP